MEMLFWQREGLSEPPVKSGN